MPSDPGGKRPDKNSPRVKKGKKKQSSDAKREKARKRMAKLRRSRSPSEREMARAAVRKQVAEHRRAMSAPNRRAARESDRRAHAEQRRAMSAPKRKAARESDRRAHAEQRRAMSAPKRRAARESDRRAHAEQRRDMSAPEREAVKADDRRRKAEPKELERDRKRKADPAVMAKTRERVARPHNRRASTIWKEREAARTVRNPLDVRRLCPHCGAATWKAEGDICCRSGKHLLRWAGAPTMSPWGPLPDEKVPVWDQRCKAAESAVLAGLYIDKGFSAASRRLNNHFAFSAIGTDTGKKGVSGGKPRDGSGDPKGEREIPSFVRLAGRVYHYIPSADDPRSTIPYYVNDALPSVAKPSDEAWVRTVHAVLMRAHPLARTLRAAREIKARDVRVVPAPNQRKPECAAEIAARFRISADSEDVPDRHFVAFDRDGGIQVYPTLSHELYESLQYPLLYPHGSVGWWARGGQMYECAAGRPMTLMWYARQRMFCEPTLHACGRLFNEWLVDTFCRMDDSRLAYLASAEGQKKLRLAEKDDVEHYCDDIEAGVGAGAEKPGRILLPSSHTGSRRQMYTLLQNACALSQRKKKATFFDTMTCNPKWNEIQDCLLPGQTHLDRPDICARVFKQKLDKVLHAISSGKWHTRWQRRHDADDIVVTCHDMGMDEHLEDVTLIWRCYVIEFQMRGLPHAHIIYRVEGQDGSQPMLAEQIDRVVQARFPSKDPATG
eukprot:gene7391-9496_t